MTEFKALYFKEEIEVINPYGDTAILILWSSKEKFKKDLLNIGIELLPEKSRIVAISNFYGNGMNQLLRNLMYNPQINNLIICGKDRSDSGIDLINFFIKGTEEIQFDSQKIYKIKDSNRYVDIPRNFFSRKIGKNDLSVYHLDKEETIYSDIKSILNSIKHEIKILRPRVASPTREIEFSKKPENPYAHVVKKDNPLDTWKELLYLCYSFGISELVEKRELRNVTSIIYGIDFLDEEKIYKDLEKYQFSKNNIDNYVNLFLDGKEYLDVSYTYGNRLKEYFGINSVDQCISLVNDGDDAGAYLTLWDNKIDLFKKERPCLCSILLSRNRDTLDLTANFRSHNLIDAWIPNVFGIAHLFKYITDNCSSLKPGRLTIISHKLSLDMDRIQIFEDVIKKRKNEINLDLNGEFRVLILDRKIIVNHIFNGITIKTYQGTTSQAIQHEIYRDRVISDINHGIYLGRQLERAELSIKNKFVFKQD